MVTKNKIIIYTLIITLFTVLFLNGCGNSNDEEEQTNYDFSVFFGSANDAIEIDALLTKYEESTGIKINPLIISDSRDNVRTLESLLNEEDPPAAYAASGDVDIEWLSEGGFIADFESINNEQKGNNFPYIIEGYGLAYDRSMFEEIFGKDDVGKVIEDLVNADYEDWVVFIEAMDNFINERSADSFSISGNEYKFPEKKGELTRDLNGVFAIAGADSDIYGYDILNTVIQTVDISSWEAVKDDLTGSALQTLSPTLTTYVNGLDLMTSNLSGQYSAGIRGSDFVNEEFYGREQMQTAFMEGKAVFSILDSDRYKEIESLNAKKAQSLEYLPIKMPYDKSSGDKTSDGAILNRSIPAEISYSLYVNGSCPADTQKMALDFLIWFTSQDERLSNSLISSTKTYIEKGNILDYNYSPPEMDRWKEIIFGDDGITQFLRKEVWSDEYKDEIKLYMTEIWCEN